MQNNNYNYYDVNSVQNPYMSLNGYLSKVFGWMALGVGVTFLVAIASVFTGVFYLLYSSMIFIGTTILELVLVYLLSARIQTLSPGTALAMFLGYSALNGLNLSVYFVVYGFGTLIFAFLMSALYFGLVAFYGATTQKDLSAWGPRLFGGLIALLVGSVIGIFFGFGLFDVLLCAAGLVLFILLTAYDTQKLKSYYYSFSGNDELVAKSAILGALSLYLDFINIFLYVVRLLGSRRD